MTKIENHSGSEALVNLTALRQKLNSQQKSVFNEIWFYYVRTGKPLPVRSLQPSIGKARVQDVLAGVSGGLIYESTNSKMMRCLNLTLLGAVLAEDGEFLFQAFVRVLGLVADLYRSDSQVQGISSSLVNERLGFTDHAEQNLFFGFLKLGLPTAAPLFVSSWADDGSWSAQITDHVLDLFTAESLPGYAETLLLTGFRAFEPKSEEERMGARPLVSGFSEVGSTDWLHGINGILALGRSEKSIPFISSLRLAQIKDVKGACFDCSRLILMCGELNECANRENAHAVIMLLRAIIDHVPPIFGYKTFREVANNYGGRRSFKEAMGSLESSSRKIADLYLHSPIQKTESLPTMTQVNFSPALDLLLGEIVTILKNCSASQA